MTVVNIRSVPNFRSGFCVQPEQSRPTAGNLSTVSAGSKLFDPFRLDTVNQCLWRRKVDGEEERILLKPKVFAILRYLVDHAGRLVTQDELLGAVWPDTFVQPEVLKRHVFDIRNVLGDDSKRPVYIETLPRRGYQFMAPVRSASPNVISANVFSGNVPGAAIVGDHHSILLQRGQNDLVDRRVARNVEAGAQAEADAHGWILQTGQARRLMPRRPYIGLLRLRYRYADGV